MEAYCVKCHAKKERPEKRNYEEWQAGNPGRMSNLRYEDVPYWKDIAASRSAYPSRCENNLSAPRTSRTYVRGLLKKRLGACPPIDESRKLRQRLLTFNQIRLSKKPVL